VRLRRLKSLQQLTHSRDRGWFRSLVWSLRVVLGMQRLRDPIVRWLVSTRACVGVESDEAGAQAKVGTATVRRRRPELFSDVSSIGSRC
jgi:hypothetical protein